VRAQIRSVATVVAVTGRLDEANVEPVTVHLCRFTKMNGPLIVDVSSSAIFALYGSTVTTTPAPVRPPTREPFDRSIATPVT
jgi:hypothetical protein